jgi:hypothetical protein
MKTFISQACAAPECQRSDFAGLTCGAAGTAGSLRFASRRSGSARSSGRCGSPSSWLIEIEILLRRPWRFFKLKGVRAKPKPYGGTALSQKPVVSIGYLSSAGALARFAVFKADEDKLSHDPLPAIAARSDWADHPDACLKVEEIAKRIRSFCAGGTVV